jgi:HSP20 family protein
MKIPVKKGPPGNLWYEPWADVWYDHRWPDFASLSYDVWVPQINFYEKKDTYQIRVELPGIDKNKIEVYIDMNTNALTVRGSITCKEEEEAEICHLRESALGPFSRRIHLPYDSQADKVTAVYKDGILNLGIPRMPVPKAKKIKIKS